jgi:hypothetical protein
VLGKDPPDHVLIDVNPEGMGNLLGDPGAAEAGVPALHFNDDLDDILRWPLGARLPSVPGRVEQPALPLLECVVKAQERRGPEDDGDPNNGALTEEKRPEIKQESIQGGEVWSSTARPADDQELLLQENTLDEDGACATRPEEPGNRRQQVPEQDEKGLHGRGA